MKNAIFNFIYNGILSRNVVLPFAKNNRFIFLLHDVSAKNNLHHHPVYSTEPKVFQRIVSWIQRHFKIVTLDEITDKNYQADYPKNLATLVFDDGFYSLKEVALPFLSQRNIPFTIFANQTAIQENWLWCSNLMMALNSNDTEYLEKIYRHFISDNSISFVDFKKDPVTCLINLKLLNDDYSIFNEEKFTSYKVYLDEMDIKEIRSKGVMIGSHTKTHKQLSSCSEKTIIDEIVNNKKYLQKLLNEEIEHFAIPFGFHTTYNDYALRIARKEHNFVYDTEKNRLKHNQALINRIGLQSEDDAKLFSYVNYPIVRGL
jgi:peptidoglycan/xylan/chitin deacetylase (PgdA/CDA1 family)